MSEVIQYMVRDPQGSVYGPAPMELIRQWVREGRITAAMQLAPEGSVDWMPAAAYGELREFFSPEAVAAATGQRVAAVPPPLVQPPAGGNPYAATVPATGGGLVNTPPRMNVMAVVSLVVSFLGCGCCLVSIAGIVVGVIAKKQIKESQGAQTGDGLALAGIIIGAVTFLLNCCAVLGWMKDAHG